MLRTMVLALLFSNQASVAWSLQKLSGNLLHTALVLSRQEKRDTDKLRKRPWLSSMFSITLINCFVAKQTSSYIRTTSLWRRFSSVLLHLLPPPPPPPSAKYANLYTAVQLPGRVSQALNSSYRGHFIPSTITNVFS